jgi:hypothetical protein
MYFLIIIVLLARFYSQDDDDCVSKSKDECDGDCYYMPYEDVGTSEETGICVSDYCSVLVDELNDYLQIPEFLSVDSIICDNVEFCEVFILIGCNLLRIRP